MYICTLANLSPIDSIMTGLPGLVNFQVFLSFFRDSSTEGKHQLLEKLPSRYTYIYSLQGQKRECSIYVFPFCGWANLGCRFKKLFAKASKSDISNSNPFNVIWHPIYTLPPPYDIFRQFTVKNRRSRSIRWEPGSFLECERQPVCVLFAWSAIVGLASRSTSRYKNLSLKNAPKNSFRWDMSVTGRKRGCVGCFK